MGFYHPKWQNFAKIFTYLESARRAGSNAVQGSVPRKSRHFTAF